MVEQFIQRIGSQISSLHVSVAALAFLAVVLIGIGILVVREQRRRAASRRLQETGQSATGSESRLLRLLERVGNYISHGRASTSLWEQLIRAGYMGRSAPAIYTGVKMMLFLVGLAGAAALVLPLEATASQKVLYISLSGAALFFVPNVVIRMQEKKRREEIRTFLPDAVDLLEICVSSGIGLDMAWNIVADEIHRVSPVLGNAMDLSNFEIHLGANRTEAMRNMAARTGAKQLSSLAAILVQSERFGTSMGVALAEFADWMRDERHLTAEENAEKMPMRLLFPMAFFIFPAIMVVALGPALIHITTTLVVH